MKYAGWVVAALLGLGAGWFFVRYLTVSPESMRLQLVAAVVCGLGAGAVAVGMGTGGGSWGAAALAGGLALVGFAGGYWIETERVLAREDDRPVPPLTRTANSPGDGHVAVVYLTHGEPAQFDPIGWLNVFRELDEDEVPFVPRMARPFFIKALRDAYIRVGSSPHTKIHRQMAAKLEKSLRAEGYDGIRVYPSFLDDEPRPDAALIQALNDGASEVVVMQVLATRSSHTIEGEELIETVDAPSLGVPVAFAGPLWDSPTMLEMFAEKAEEARGSTPVEEVGVLLVGHGQPNEWDKLYPTQTSQELEFRERIMDRLARDGYRPENMSMAWMEFKEPGVVEKAREMAASGVDKIIYFSAAISADSIHSTYDTPELMHEAALPPEIELVNAGAWNDHPLVIQAIEEQVADRLGPPPQKQ